MDGDRHVIGYFLAQETRVRNALDDLASNYYPSVPGFGVPPCCTWLQDPVLCGCEAALAIKSALKADGHRCAIGLTTGEVGGFSSSARDESAWFQLFDATAFKFCFQVHLPPHPVCRSHPYIHSRFRVLVRDDPPARCSAGPSGTPSAPRQGLTLVHFSVQRKYLLWDTFGDFGD